MRQRISLAILGMLVAALLLVGLGTIVFSYAGARRATERDLSSQASGVSEIFRLGTITRRGTLANQRLQLLQTAQRNRILKGLKVDGIEVVDLTPDGSITGDLPVGVLPADLNYSQLVQQNTVAGFHGRRVFAAAPIGTGASGSLPVVVLSRAVDNQWAGVAGWFLLSSALTLALGVIVALWLSRTLTRPLAHANQATQRIAAGDLTTRIPDPKPHQRDELSDLARSINTMAENLERSRGLEQQFLLSVSHDLRTPLTSIRGYSEAITDGTAPDPVAAATIIGSESRRLERLVRDLLDLAKLDARRFSLHQRPVEVNEVVVDTAEGFRREVEAHSLTLVVDEDPTRAVANIDPDRFAQVVANLLENALKYARTTVRISTVAHGGDATSGAPPSVSVVVADDGPGIAEVDLPFVFERLYVAQHHPVRKESGSGLGLAIVRELTLAMGGTAVAQAQPSGGTRMVVTLPGVSRATGAAPVPSVPGPST